MKQILVVEDEQSIAHTITHCIEREGFSAVWRERGLEGLALLKEGGFSLVVLDIGLPDVSGFELCKSIRLFSQVPVIFLTARDEEIDKIVGLEIGADDYVSKPFSPRELAARIKSVLRRAEAAQAALGAQARVMPSLPGAATGGVFLSGPEHVGAEQPVVDRAGTVLARAVQAGIGQAGTEQAGTEQISQSVTGKRSGGVYISGGGGEPFFIRTACLCVDEARMQALYLGRRLELTRYEFHLLMLLASTPGRVYSREQIMRNVWGEDSPSLDRTVDAHVKSLRAKFRELDGAADPIVTHRGTGYALRDDL